MKEMLRTAQLDEKRIPRHVAIIMDGNGRWAKQQGMERSLGHQAGAEAMHIVAETATELGIEFLTLYAFSTENWSRPKYEVNALVALLFSQIDEAAFAKNNIRFNVIGDMKQFPELVCKKLAQCIENTSGNTGMVLTLALSYSSRWEITEAVKAVAREVKNGTLQLSDIDAQTVAGHLSTKDIPDPDLLIRTGGELRLSNYLLWQCAYTELYFCDTYWPNFKKEEFIAALADYQKRERRFGKISEQLQNSKELYHSTLDT